MRKLIWGGVLACLFAGGLGVYFTAFHRLDERPMPMPDQEEQEAAPISIGDLAPASPGNPGPAEDAIEPIVVEGTVPEPPSAPEFGGVTVPGRAVRVEAIGASPPPRPDDEPGQPVKMPYAKEPPRVPNALAQLVEALCRVWTGFDVAPAETDEPAVFVSEAVPPTETKEPPLAPAIDHRYHLHEMHCPYTGRCPVPHYPVPPPAAPESK
jgi:hypothetical protein